MRITAWHGRGTSSEPSQGRVIWSGGRRNSSVAGSRRRSWSRRREYVEYAARPTTPRGHDRPVAMFRW